MRSIIHSYMCANVSCKVYHFDHTVPRVKGGGATVMKQIIVSPTLTEAVSQIVRVPSKPKTRKLAI